MPAAGPVGVAVTPFETRADVVLRVAERADELGLDHMYVAEGWTHDAFVLLAQLAGRTSRVRLGSGIVSVWSRTPATIAMGAASLQRCTQGRFTLGLGASSPPLVEGFHCVGFQQPVARLRATLTAVRALLDGERMPAPVDGSRALRLGVTPEGAVPIALAALAPASVRLAGELADEWAPFLWARSQLGPGLELLRDGEARAAFDRPTRVSAAVPVALAPDEAAARRLAAWWLIAYTTRMGPLYPRMLGERFGMAAAVDAVLAVAEEARPDLPAAAEELARDVTLFGTYDEAGAAIGAWFDAGADVVDLVLPPGRPEEELLELVAVAGRVAGASA
jgi:alkanesulfonate monooxygenase SsuD/methylene tetrahydromethanopterin reductase-like flavin-dependent oxidoreductase (luciferase family)